MEMQLRWGMGPALGLVAFAGLGWSAVRAARRGRAASAPALVALAWSLPFFLLTGSFYVKFMRYLLPLVPFLMVEGAAFIGWVGTALADSKGRYWLRRSAQPVLVALVLVLTGLYALSFVTIYRQPHPWVAASLWIYEQIPPGATILGEQWDDLLPATLLRADASLQRSQYNTPELTWMTGVGPADSRPKLERNLALLAEADYVALATNRVYGVVPRLPDRYPLSSQYYHLLFSGALGYDAVYTGGRFPALGGFHFKADTFSWPGLEPPPAVTAYYESKPGINWGRVDESFIVYDQPPVIIFANNGRLTAAEMLALFDLEP
jgi:hypothetical protein